MGKQVEGGVGRCGEAGGGRGREVWGSGWRVWKQVEGGVGRCGEADGGRGREVWGSRWRVG